MSDVNKNLVSPNSPCQDSVNRDNFIEKPLAAHANQHVEGSGIPQPGFPPQNQPSAIEIEQSDLVVGRHETKFRHHAFP